MVYFILNATNAEMKIGFSDRAVQRIRDLENELKREFQSLPDEQKRIQGRRHISNKTGRRLVVIAAITGDRNREKIFHDLFSEHRVHGEWFSYQVIQPIISLLAFGLQLQVKNAGMKEDKEADVWKKSVIRVARDTSMKVLWDWVNDGVCLPNGKIILEGKITWQGMRRDANGLSNDISGAKVDISDDEMAQFGRGVQELAMKCAGVYVWPR